MGPKVGYIFTTKPYDRDGFIKLATLHLDDEAHEWWYHGLVTMGHNTIASYSDFTQRLMGMFDKRDSKIHFRDLT